MVGVSLIGRGEEIREIANCAWMKLLGTKFLITCRQKRDSLVRSSLYNVICRLQGLLENILMHINDYYRSRNGTDVR